MYSLDLEKAEQSIGLLEKAGNASVAEAFDQLAAAVKPHAGESALMDQIIEACVQVQAVYNDQYLPALTGTIESFRAVYDIAEYDAKKASVGEVAKVGIDAKIEKIDPAAVASL